jgi:hypothetical protein
MFELVTRKTRPDNATWFLDQYPEVHQEWKSWLESQPGFVWLQVDHVSDKVKELRFWFTDETACNDFLSNQTPMAQQNRQHDQDQGITREIISRGLI